MTAEGAAVFRGSSRGGGGEEPFGDAINVHDVGAREADRTGVDGIVERGEVELFEANAAVLGSGEVMGFHGEEGVEEFFGHWLVLSHRCWSEESADCGSEYLVVASPELVYVSTILEKILEKG